MVTVVSSIGAWPVQNSEKPAQQAMADVVQYLNVNQSDGRYGVQGTWADKMSRFGDRPTPPIGEVRADNDFARMPRDVRCYVVYIPSLKVIRWARADMIADVLGGARHDFLNRGDAIRETNPRRGYLTFTSRDVLQVTSGN